MNIIITARKFKAHDTLKEFINAEVSLLERYNEGITRAEIILSYQNLKINVKTAEIILQVPGQTLTAKEETDDFKKSITASVEKLSRQLKKIKTKRLEYAK